MKINSLKPRKALNKAFLKVKPNRTEIEGFKTNLITLLNRTNDTESEEFHKNLVSDFLKDTYYKQNHFINTKGRNDLVIHNGTNATSAVGVILEAKKPTNKSEMVTSDRINTKAFQELVLYYLRERITHKNLEVKHLVITNINEWFIFDATLFDSLFAQNKNLVKQFNDFESGRLADSKTDFFYKQIAEPFIDSITTEIEFTYFNIQDFQKPLRNADKADDNSLIALFKLLSPEHLLKLPFTNDSNSLDKRFYSELLHIIGLTETKEGSKKLIGRNKAGERNTGSILENAMVQLDSLDKLSRLDRPNQFGDSPEEKLFNVALELSITWINRILFLKLLEAQLITYHKAEGVADYRFLTIDKIRNYDDLNSLFFQVLARKHNERNEDVKQLFKKVPYLNSSLFEPTDMEQVTLFISNLKDDKTIPIISSTVLKDQQGKKRTGNLSTLEYLFEFLNAYDFSSEGSEEIQEDNKTLINASVLGLIFEKINGYKDGSFFTPGFITMYMCRETIRRAVVQKFNESSLIPEGEIKSIDAIYELIPRQISRKQANEIVNSIKICDPAVGSGHFLVSALNELIAVKNDLKILEDREGKSLHRYEVEVVNDELIVTDEDGELFDYNPNNKESQRIQETLFHEKQTLIENCLFGVDINSNSVKICRLRLWIELLKNAYYIQSSSPKLGEVSAYGGQRGQEQINNLPYLKTFRKELRNTLTPAEAKLWTLLKGRGLEGRKFRRQHSVANYILDFYCPEENLAIELDGQGHFEASQAEYDQDRDLFLEAFGIRVLRFENKWVWDNPEELLNEIKNYFGKQPPKSSPPFEGGVARRVGVVENYTQLPNSSSPDKGRWPPTADGGVTNYTQPPRQPLADTPPSKGGEPFLELQTLPNIDINIKCGNSLVSRFAIDADLKQALKKSKWSIDSYRLAVATYRNAINKEQKREMERLIAAIKSDFRSEISLNDPKVKRLRKLSGELFQLTNQQQLFEMSKKEKAAWNKKVQQITQETKKLELEIEEIKANKIFENAFEWRFEFPEVLNDDGDFVGFDVVIGNPPYGRYLDIDEKLKEHLKSRNLYGPTGDIAEFFIRLVSLGLLKKTNFAFSFIVPKGLSYVSSWSEIRNILLNKIFINQAIDTGRSFDEAAYEMMIFIASSEKQEVVRVGSISENHFESSLLNVETYKNGVFFFGIPKNSLSIAEKIIKNSKPVQHYYEYWYGKGGMTPKVNRKGIGYKVLTGKETQRYFIKDIHEKWFLEEKYLNEIDIRRANKRKVVVQDIVAHITKPVPRIKLAATIDYQNQFCLNTVMCFSAKGELSNEFLVGLINSSLMSFFFYYFIYNQAIRTMHFMPGYADKVPISNNLLKSVLIEELVTEILSNKIQNPETDTTSLENQIDQLVYQLYELTEEEIAIIESATQ